MKIDCPMAPETVLPDQDELAQQQQQPRKAGDDVQIMVGSALAVFSEPEARKPDHADADDQQQKHELLRVLLLHVVLVADGARRGSRGSWKWSLETGGPARTPNSWAAETGWFYATPLRCGTTAGRPVDCAYAPPVLAATEYHELRPCRVDSTPLKRASGCRGCHGPGNSALNAYLDRACRAGHGLRELNVGRQVMRAILGACFRAPRLENDHIVCQQCECRR